MYKKVVIVLLALVAGWQLWAQRGGHATVSEDAAPSTSSVEASAEFRPGERVEATGVVERVLADDTSGSRHQRFIVRLPSGQSLLIAHNIDIAPRVEGIDRGDTVSFSGIYEPNDKGGVVHWTHHDPSGRHAAGWIEHRGHRYQ